jgi:hypothetical protein
MKKKDSYDCLQLTLDDGREIAFSSTDVEQDSTSCHWHIHQIRKSAKIKVNVRVGTSLIRGGLIQD